MSLPATAPYMSIIPGRFPKNKAHLTLGDAKKAVLHKLQSNELDVPCMVYKWEPTGWERLWKIDAGTLRAELPWKAPVPSVSLETKHADIADLIALGASFDEIIERGPFKTWASLRNSLKLRDRQDLLGAMEEKIARIGMADLRSSRINANKLTHGSFSLGRSGS